MLAVDIAFILIASLVLIWILGLLRALNSDAPFVPIDPTVIRTMLSMIDPKPGDVWIDLGSGDGRVLISACRRFPQVRCIGIERIGSLRLLARLKVFSAGLGSRIRFRGGNFFDHDISEASIVSFYLSQATNDRLIEKFRRELAPGALLISHRFAIPNLPLLHEDAAQRIYVARIP